MQKTAPTDLFLKLCIIVGVVGILASVFIVAQNPAGQEIAVCDTKRNWAIREVQNALQHYRSDNNEFPDHIPIGIGHAKEICRYGLSYDSCVDLSALVPDYISTLPTDDAEEDVRLMGFSVYQEAPHVWVTADNIGRTCLGSTLLKN